MAYIIQFNDDSYIRLLMNAKRTVFFVSDRTGITVEMLGHSLLTQFEGVQFGRVALPFVDTVERAEEVREKINRCAAEEVARPRLYSSLVRPEARAVIASADALFVDLFESLIGALEAELGMKSSHAMGRSHGMSNGTAYQQRINAVNFALSHDDGAATRDLGNADIILVGVSRSGKTPTCLYLALHYGIRAANYPLTPEDFAHGELPAALRPHQPKLYGLSINPERLRQIRHERMPNSGYASLATCAQEVHQAEALFHAKGIRFLDSSTKSIEEIATTILQQTNLSRAQ